MPVGNVSFGTGTEVEGFVPPTPPTPERAGDDLHRIAEKYDIPPLFQPRANHFTAYQARAYNFTNSKVNCIAVTVTSGLVYVFIGDQSNGTGVAPGVPHFVVSAAISAQTVIIPLPQSDNYIITVQEAANSTADCCLSAMGL